LVTVEDVRGDVVDVLASVTVPDWEGRSLPLKRLDENVTP
jgi:hypothetical protein